MTDVATTEQDETFQRAVRHLREFVQKRVRARQRNDRRDQGVMPWGDYEVVAAHMHDPRTKPEERRELRKLLASAENNDY